MNLTDSDLLDWLEYMHAQLWFNSRDGRWTCQVLTGLESKRIIQPDGWTCREAAQAAHRAWVELCSSEHRGVKL